MLFGTLFRYFSCLHFHCLRMHFGFSVVATWCYEHASMMQIKFHLRQRIHSTMKSKLSSLMLNYERWDRLIFKYASQMSSFHCKRQLCSMIFKSNRIALRSTTMATLHLHLIVIECFDEILRNQ